MGERMTGGVPCRSRLAWGNAHKCEFHIDASFYINENGEGVFASR